MPRYFKLKNFFAVVFLFSSVLVGFFNYFANALEVGKTANINQERELEMGYRKVSVQFQTMPLSQQRE
jgi:hypothetical protein